MPHHQANIPLAGHGVPTEPGPLFLSEPGRPSAPAGNAWISFTMRGLEPWVAWSIAGYTAWTALFAFPGEHVLWVFVCYAILIGEWCRACPARHQLEMFRRGLSLIAGAYVLHLSISPEVADAGNFFFWLAITSLYYAFMLQPAWGLGVVCAALGAFVLSSIHAGGLVQPIAPLLARGGFLFVFPLIVAMKFGVAMRRSDDMMEESLIDRTTGLYNKLGLIEHGDELLSSFRREKKEISLIVIDCAQLREVREVHGRKAARLVLEKTVRKFLAMAGDLGLVAHTDTAEFTVVLPLSAEKCLPVIRRVLGASPEIAYVDKETSISMSVTVAVESVRPGEVTIANLHEQLVADLLGAAPGTIAMAATPAARTDAPMPSRRLAAQ